MGMARQFSDGRTVLDLTVASLAPSLAPNKDRSWLMGMKPLPTVDQDALALALGRSRDVHRGQRPRYAIAETRGVVCRGLPEASAHSAPKRS